MKGFLRRSLESAQGAEQRLKPLAGSVRAGNRRRPEIQSESWGDETSYVSSALNSIPQSRHPAFSQHSVTSAPPPLLPVAPASLERAISAENRSEPRASSASDSRVAPSAASPDQQSATRPAARAAAFEAPAPLLAPLPAGRLPRLSGSERSEDFRADRDVRQPPQEILPEKTRQPDEARLAAFAQRQRVEPPRPEPLLRSAMAARPANPAPHLPKNRPPQEPDIHVNIGRIEIIAATPQPPRVPSPGRNPATSLADYLSGQNGRSR